MEKTLKCEACSKEFVSRKKSAKYCSVGCYRSYGVKKARPNKRIERVSAECKGCGKEFSQRITENKKYCSFRCYRDTNRSPHKGLVKTCKNCGENFVTTAKDQTCCSKKCSIDNLIKANGGQQVEERPCKGCGIYFKPRENNRYFCSIECYKKIGRERRSVNCVVCGKTFNRKNADQELCSIECRNISLNGEGNGHFKGYVHNNNGYLRYTFNHPEHPGKYVHNVLWRKHNPSGKCERCGSDVEHIHHRDRNKVNNELSNLEGLCVPCHRREHTKDNEEKFRNESIL